MEQMLQNEPTELSVQAVPQKAVEQACFHALTLISRNCEYLDQHLARTGADQESRQAVTDISAASAQLDRTVNEVMTLLEYLRAEELPRLTPWTCAIFCSRSRHRRIWSRSSSRWS